MNAYRMINIFAGRERKIQYNKFHKLNCTVIPITLLIAAIISSQTYIIGASAVARSSITTTTTNPPTAYIEDASNSFTSESSEDDSDCQTKCFQQVEVTQSHIRVYMDLMKKQNNIINSRTNKAATTSTTSISAKTSRKPKPGQQQNSSSTLMNRTLNKPIVVSRLRVARSTYFETNNEPSISEFDSTTNNSKKNTHQKLKKLRHKQRQQFNETCKSIYALQKCLDGISRECLGDLQFHSLEVFATQWFSKFNCPPPSNPSFKLFAELTRSIPDEEREKVPIARPLSSEEETQRKLDILLGGGGGPRTSLGVMLRPGLARAASQKFDSSDVDANGQLKARNIFSGNEILDYSNKKSYSIPLTGQLLLIPCFLVLLVFIITLTNRIKDCRSYK